MGGDMYKIVDKDMRSYMKHIYTVKYEPYEWTKPKIGKFFVFEYLIDALNFIDKCLWENICIYHCEVKNPITSITRIPEFVTGYEIADYWSRYTDDNRYDYKNVPKGTILCDEVQLTEQVELYEIISAIKNAEN